MIYTAPTALLLKAVDAKNVEGIVDAGDKLDKACETCHLKYWYPNQSAILEEDRTLRFRAESPLTEGL